MVVMLNICGVGDVKNTTFIGNTRPATIVAFDHNVLADTVGKAWHNIYG